MLQKFLPWSVVALLVSAGTLLGTAAFAQPNDPSSPPKVEPPLVIYHMAGVDRLLERIDVMFSAAERTELSGKTLEFLKTTLHDLNGMDRTRPSGLMMYLKPGLGGLSGIAYVPVSNVDDFLHTLSNQTGNVSKVDGKANRYRVSGTGQQTYQALHRSGYVFIVSEEEASELDRNFPVPDKMVSKLNSRYDVALSLQIKSIPPATRQLFITFLQTQSAAELQKKDNEPESAYRVRKANGENTLELIEKIVTQGEELTLGGRLDDKSGLGEVDIEVSGTPDSKLAKFFQGMTGKRSLFANLLTRPSMLSMAMSWQLDEKQRKAFTELLQYAPGELQTQAEKGGIEGTKAILDPLVKTLQQSAESGHLDGFLQVVGEGQGGYTFLAGLRVSNGANFPKQLHEALRFSQEKFGHINQIANLELDVQRIDSFPVHRLPVTPPDKPGQWMFGEGANVHVYASTQALWLSFGGEDALKNLKSAVETAKKPAQQAEERQQRIPFIFQTRGKQWATIRQESGVENVVPAPNDPRNRRPGMNAQVNEQFRSAFDESNDGLRVEIRPTDSGARAHFEFQKGWVGLLGRLIAVQIDRSTNANAGAAPSASQLK